MIRDIIDIKIKMIITKKMLCKFTAIDPQRKKKASPLAGLGSHEHCKIGKPWEGWKKKRGKPKPKKST